jgi:hypothetical protein
MTVPRRRVGKAVALAWLLAVTAGCIFSNRDPEQGTGPQIPLHRSTLPDSVLYNIRVSLEWKSADSYGLSLGTDFTFEPDPADESEINDPTFWEGWNRDREIRAFDDILTVPDAARIAFAWPPPIPTPLGGDNPDEVYYRDLKYELRLTGVASPVTVSGRVDLYLAEANGLWSVSSWVDKRDGSPNRTLGYIRWKGRLE